jgi:hypothetical protein
MRNYQNNISIDDRNTMAHRQPGLTLAAPPAIHNQIGSNHDYR